MCWEVQKVLLGVAAKIHMGVLELPILDKTGVETGKVRYQLSNYKAVFDVANAPHGLGRPYVDFVTKQEFPVSDGYNEISLEPTPEYLASVLSGLFVPATSGCCNLLWEARCPVLEATAAA
jgi:hypothetical protein